MMQSMMLNQPIRSGKWTDEENEYAVAIAEAFHEGTIEMKPEDTDLSLRKFLAKKLMCSPKRVSKKYESSGYNGKRLYARKLTATQEEIRKTMTKLNQLETRFLESIGGLGMNPPPAAESSVGLQEASPSLAFSPTLHAGVNPSRDRSNNVRNSTDVDLPIEPFQDRQSLSSNRIGIPTMSNLAAISRPGSTLPLSFPSLSRNATLSLGRLEQQHVSAETALAALVLESQRQRGSVFSGLSVEGIARQSERSAAPRWNTNTLNLRPSEGAASHGAASQKVRPTVRNEALFDVRRAQMRPAWQQFPSGGASLEDDLLYSYAIQDKLLRNATRDASHGLGNYASMPRTVDHRLSSSLNLESPVDSSSLLLLQQFRGASAANLKHCREDSQRKSSDVGNLNRKEDGKDDREHERKPPKRGKYSN